MQQTFEILLELLKKPSELEAIRGNLWWDEKTQCPRGARIGMAAKKARIAGLAHEAFVTDEIGNCLDELKANLNGFTEPQRLFVGRLSMAYGRGKAIPLEFVTRKERVTSLANAAWEQAKQSGDFTVFAPHLTTVIDLTKEEVGYYGATTGDADSIYTALLQGYEPGLTSQRLREISQTVRQWLVPFLIEIKGSLVKPSGACLRGFFRADLQDLLSRDVLRTIGYNFRRGNLSLTTHPFMTTLGPGDTRVTTNYKEDFLSAGFFATLHEGGHALFEQGADPMLEWTGVSDSIHSLGIHESQSRMWENMVGRSWPFWEFYYPKLCGFFPQFAEVPLDDFLRSVNVVQPSPIRIYADEVTYNLHILVRVEIEMALLSGQLTVDDLPAAFAEKMREYIGYDPKNFQEGVLQDVHWSMGSMGYFGTYMLGNLTAAQQFASFKAQCPGYEREFARGNFRVLLDWLRPRVHQYGLIRDLDGLLEDVTGEPLNPDHWFRYIEKKFGELYNLN